MNKYTKLSHFVQSAKHIQKKSDLLIRENTVIVDEVLYERLKKSEYRFFFSVDDYDYLEDKEMIEVLEVLFKKRKTRKKS